MREETTHIWMEHAGEGPLVATAVHAGHKIRGELMPILALDEATRLREEDPYTDMWVRMVPSWLIVTRSRFEVDVNRQRDEAVYRTPEMAWGLHLWKAPLKREMIERSLEEYDDFYRELEQILAPIAARYRHFVVFDLHTYNYRRAGPDAPPEDPATHPEVNVGTGTMDRVRCAQVVERFIRDLRRFDFLGRQLDVRENVKFRGRQLAKWVHEHFPQSCVLAVEFKKFFMDEWTGEGDKRQIQAIQEALNSTVPGVLEELARMDSGDA